jgi:hypothetical protein
MGYWLKTRERNRQMDGYIKLYRKLLDNPIVCKDVETLGIWIYLLLNATHKKVDVLFNSKKITLEPGQLITGRKAIAAKLKVDESKVERTLKMLKNEQQIEQQTSSKNRLITILNWELYQQNEQQLEQQVNNERTTSEQQVNTNKNEKNVKNERNNISIAQFEEFWKAYPKKRSKENCLKWYLKNKPTEEEQKQILLAIAFFKNDKQWKDEQYIPYPSTFLNQKRWEDIK